jgi:hypothetical protein
MSVEVIDEQYGRVITLPIPVPRRCFTCGLKFKDTPKVLANVEPHGIDYARVYRECPNGHIWRREWQRDVTIIRMEAN